jgi:hypothetical protein
MGKTEILSDTDSHRDMNQYILTIKQEWYSVQENVQ